MDEDELLPIEIPWSGVPAVRGRGADQEDGLAAALKELEDLLEGGEMSAKERGELIAMRLEVQQEIRHREYRERLLEGDE